MTLHLICSLVVILAALVVVEQALNVEDTGRAVLVVVAALALAVLAVGSMYLTWP